MEKELDRRPITRETFAAKFYLTSRSGKAGRREACEHMFTRHAKTSDGGGERGWLSSSFLPSMQIAACGGGAMTEPAGH